MDDATARALVALNRAFYRQMAAPFADSRAAPSPGFARLLPFLPVAQPTVLDVGCGEGRFGRFLRTHDRLGAYTGVDFSSDLLEAARAHDLGACVEVDLLAPGCLAGFGRFDVVACLATLHHIPGAARRARLLAEMAGCLAPGGRLLVSTWQFLDSPRQRRKLADWGTIGLDPTAVEPGDHLLTWQRGGTALRYVAHIDAAALERLAAAAGLRVVARFRSDGREGDLALYGVLGSAEPPPPAAAPPADLS